MLIRLEPSPFPLAPTCIAAHRSRWSTPPVKAAHWETGPILLASEQWRNSEPSGALLTLRLSVVLDFSLFTTSERAPCMSLAKRKEMALVCPACLCDSVAELGSKHWRFVSVYFYLVQQSERCVYPDVLSCVKWWDEQQRTDDMGPPTISVYILI